MKLEICAAGQEAIQSAVVSQLSAISYQPSAVFCTICLNRIAEGRWLIADSRLTTSSYFHLRAQSLP